MIYIISPIIYRTHFNIKYPICQYKKIKYSDKNENNEIFLNILSVYGFECVKKRLIFATRGRGNAGFFIQKSVILHCLKRHLVADFQIRQAFGYIVMMVILTYLLFGDIMKIGKKYLILRSPFF